MSAEGVGRLFAVDKIANGPMPEHYEPVESPIDTNPLHPNVVTDPTLRIYKEDREFIGSNKEYPFVATTYRLTEHFHSWTAQSALNIIAQPQQFVEIGEKLAAEKGIQKGDMVKITSRRGYIKAVAVVTKRLKDLEIDGRVVHHIGLPIHWNMKALNGKGNRGFSTNTLTPSWGEAITQTPEYKTFLVNIEKLGRHNMAGTAQGVQTQDVIKISATSGLTPAPQARAHKVEVAKLIDVSTCIGCKACQVGCSEWNDIRSDINAQCVGVYDNPVDLDAKAWTVMRFNEVEENDRLEWLIRKDGCMHCTEPGCLKACPAPGAIIQYANGIVDFQSDKCIGCGYCIAGCPFNIPRMNPEDNRVYKCTLCVDRVSVGQEPACVKTCPTGAIRFGSKEEMKIYAEQRVADLKSRGYENAGLYDPPGVGGTHVMYVLHHADKPELYNGLPKDPQIDVSVTLWKDVLKPVAAVAMGGLALAEVAHYLTVGPNVEEDVEDHHHEFEENKPSKGKIMSKIEISNDTRVIRHRTPARISHWMLVICFL